MKFKSNYLSLLGFVLVGLLFLTSGNTSTSSLNHLTKPIEGIDLAPSAKAKAVTLAGSPAYAAGTWVPTGGPIGGLGYDVRMDPNNPDVMYVTDSWAGVFKSTDGGANWFPINNGITTRLGPSNDGIPVFSLTIDPNNSNRIWVGTQYSSDVFLSEDGGNTWALKSNGITETQLSIRGFTVEPGNSNIVYLAAEISSWEWNGTPLPGLGLDMVKGAVYKTTDGGLNWTKKWEGDNLARYVWIHPQNHNLLYVSTGIFDREAANSDSTNKIPGGVGILRSDNGGLTWQVLDEANGFDPLELYFGSLYMHPTNPNILLASAGNDPYTTVLNSPLGGIYRTVNGGDTWVEVLGPHNFSAVEFCEGHPNVAYAGALDGFYRSEDSGQTWLQVGGVAWGPPGIVAGFPIDIQCDPRNPMRLFVNNYGGGNFLSIDGGLNWMVSSKGYTGALMRDIAVVPQNSARVYTTARSGVFGSYDGGNRWLGLSNDIARWMEMLALGVDPGNPQHLLISNVDLGPNPLESRNGGQAWSLLNTGIIFQQGNTLLRIIFAPSNSQVIYASIGSTDCLVGGVCDTVPGQGVIISRNGGASWEKTTLPVDYILGIDVFAEDSSIAYAAVVGGGLYKTENTGVTWQLVNPNPGLSLQNESPIVPQPKLVRLTIDPMDPQKLYAGFWDGGLAVSLNGGLNWQSSAVGMPPEADVMAIVVDPTDSNVVYAGALDSGVYLSKDGGGTWASINEGLLTRAVRSLGISGDGSVLYMAAEGGGVFRLGSPPPQENSYLPFIIND
jgi:photosystem II stability/assembly factor-like uncharacterized protein